MKNLRKYGAPPFNVAVIHGGPGAPGEMAPVARNLSSSMGVLEPLQTATSLKGQVQELKKVITKNANSPIKLIGHSWGAMLSYIFAAQYPSLISKLILVASGVFDKKYAKDIMNIRLSRLDEDEKKQVENLMDKLNNSNIIDNSVLTHFGYLMSKTDSYKTISHKNEVISCQHKTYKKVWKEAEELRAKGDFLRLGKKIKCPVVAIHGDYDPHSAEGIKNPLSSIIKDFKFILLEKCGHTPWFEFHVKEKFYKIIKDEL